MTTDKREKLLSRQTRFAGRLAFDRSFSRFIAVSTYFSKGRGVRPRGVLLRWGRGSLATYFSNVIKLASRGVWLLTEVFLALLQYPHIFQREEGCDRGGVVKIEQHPLVIVANFLKLKETN